MKAFASILASAATLSLCNANAIVVPRDASPEILAAEALAVPLSGIKRALPNSPSGGYAPAVVNCPATRPTIREASSLSPNEIAWLPIRRNATVDPMITWLTRMNISGFDATTYINNYRNNATALPNIGIAASGGGYRALMNGAGFLAAADNRTNNATNTGQIGGLLQATTYLAGLSGGGWLVGSIYSNNFSSVQDLRDGSSGSNVWKFDNSVLEGPNGDGIQLLSTADYFSTIHDEVESKENAGYETSITDYWGRTLSFQLVNATDGGPSYTFSSIALQDFFTSGSVPMPIFVTDGRAPNTTIVSLNSTVYEFSPFELGSWDPTTYGFVPLEYIGSNFSGGFVPENGSCVRGFDQAGFMMGTSSTLFNEVLVELNTSSIPSFLTTIFTNLLDDVGFSNNDIAQYQPNPFYGFNNATNRNAQSNELTLVDGGEDGQNIPLYPLIQPQRGLDVIFAIDSSADVNNWPNGTSLVATYQRSLNNTIENGTAFPSIPDQNTFVNLGLNNHPTMFGCNISNITGTSFTTSGYVPPLIVYVPNAPYITFSNVSTYDLQYNDTQRNLIIRNGYDVATQGNGTIDSEWPTCMGCAVMQRSWYKTGTTIPSVCQTCFDRYCWNGTVDSSELESYYPALKSDEVGIKSAAPSVKAGACWTAVAVIVAMVLV